MVSPMENAQNKNLVKISTRFQETDAEGRTGGPTRLMPVTRTEKMEWTSSSAYREFSRQKMEENGATKKFNDISEIQSIGPLIAKKLSENGLNRLEILSTLPAKTLVQSIGLSITHAEKIISEARGLLSDRNSNSQISIGFESAFDFYERRRRIKRISSGCRNFDLLLGGGMETGEITELAGEYRTGKTQLAMTYAVRCQLPPNENGINSKAIFLDTEGTFRPERIVQIAESLGLDTESTLKNILYARIYTSDHQIETVKHLPQQIDPSVGLIVVDSVISHFRSEFIEPKQMPERQAKINSHLHDLARLANAFDIAVLITNQVATRPENTGLPTAFSGISSSHPTGGNILGHAASTRLLLRTAKADMRVARLFDSPHLPESEAVFRITTEGIA